MFGNGLRQHLVRYMHFLIEASTHVINIDVSPIQEIIDNFFKPPDGVPYLKYLDPSGALLIGIYIIYSWWKMGAGKPCKNNLSTLLKISRHEINAIFDFRTHSEPVWLQCRSGIPSEDKLHLC